MRVKVKVNVQPKTQAAEDDWIMFLEEGLEKKGDLRESQELFQEARENPPEVMKSLNEFVRDSRKNENKGAEELSLKKRYFRKKSKSSSEEQNRSRCKRKKMQNIRGLSERTGPCLSEYFSPSRLLALRTREKLEY